MVFGLNYGPAARCYYYCYVSMICHLPRPSCCFPPYSSSSPSPLRLPATSKSKLVRSSFRIEEGVLRALVVAAERDISLSGLVNKTLKNYTTWEMYLEELGFILVRKTFLRKIFDRLDEKDIEELGKEYGLIF